MKRREFFKELSAFGLLASCARYSMAATDCQLFYAPEPSPNELMDMPIMRRFHPTRLEIRVGAKRPFRMLHFSDSHLAYMNARDLVKADDVEHHWYESDYTHFKNAAQGLAAALAYSKANKMHRLHTGDLLDYISDANLRWMQCDFEGYPTLYAIGNHEFSGTSRPAPKLSQRKAARARLEPCFSNPFACHAQIIEGVNFVAFDNVGMCADIADEQFESIRREFEKGLPTVVACHIPFYTPGLIEWFKVKFPKYSNDTSSIGESLVAAVPGKPSSAINSKMFKFMQEAKNLEAILCGHLHYESRSEFREDVFQYVAGATFKGNAYDITFV